MNSGNRPSAEARWLSHLLVGCAAGAVAGKRSGVVGFVTTAIVGAFLHDALDAPLATVLTDFGA